MKYEDFNLLVDFLDMHDFKSFPYSEIAWNKIAPSRDKIYFSVDENKYFRALSIMSQDPDELSFDAQIKDPGDKCFHGFENWGVGPNYSSVYREIHNPFIHPLKEIPTLSLKDNPKGIFVVTGYSRGSNFYLMFIDSFTSFVCSELNFVGLYYFLGHQNCEGGQMLGKRFCIQEKCKVYQFLQEESSNGDIIPYCNNCLCNMEYINFWFKCPKCWATPPMK